MLPAGIVGIGVNPYLIDDVNYFCYCFSWYWVSCFDEGQKFIPNQFTNDFVVKVDAHSNSPIFTEDLRSLAFALADRGAMTKERLIDILEPPMKQLLKEDLRKMEQAAQAAQTMQNPQPEPETAAGPMLQRVV